MFAAVLVLAAAVLFLVRRQGALSGSVDALMAENRRLQEQESAMEAEIDALRRKKKLGRLSVEGTEQPRPRMVSGIHQLPRFKNHKGLWRQCFPNCPLSGSKRRISGGTGAESEAFIPGRRKFPRSRALHHH